MYLNIFLCFLYNLWCLVSAAETGENLLDISLASIEFKENFYEINDNRTFVNVNTYYTNIEETTSHTTHYNKSLILNFLCFGRNFTGPHRLTWHQYIGGTEVGSVSVDTTDANNNFTLSLRMRSYDNESLIFCTAFEPYSETVINKTSDMKVKMGGFRNQDFAVVTVCHGNYSEGSTEPCEIGNRHNLDVELRQRINKEHASVYEDIPSLYYNEHFPIVKHRCSAADKSIIKSPDGTVRLNVNHTLKLTKADNGTIIHCQHFKRTSVSFQLNEEATVFKSIRDNYNERVFVYNELYWNDRNFQNDNKPVNLFTILIITVGTVITMAIIFNVVVCIYRWTRKRHIMERGNSRKAEDNYNSRRLEDVSQRTSISNDLSYTNAVFIQH